MEHILDVHKLSMSYDGKTFALSDCTFFLEKGSLCAIVGESGCGKSTLLRLIAGLERPNAGSISINGTLVSDDSTHISPQKRNVGLVFQDFSLFPHLTVAQNISYGLKNKQTDRVQELLSLIKMEGYANKYPSQLSGGQEQRIALARTLAVNPEILLLDEPFSNLDAYLKSELRHEIKDIVSSLGTTLNFITQDLFDAIDIAEEVIFLKDGRMLQHSSIEAFCQNIEHEEVRKIMVDLKTNAEQISAFINIKQEEKK